MNILNHPLIIIIIVLCILAEWIYSRFNSRIQFSRYEAFSNFAIIGIDKTMGWIIGEDGTGAGNWLSQYKLLSWDFGFFSNLFLTFMAAEFFYYCTHWYNHNVNLGWCTHVVHHSPTQMNLTVGYRLGVTRFISLGWLIFMPAVLLGFDPVLLGTILGLILLYQFFIHTEVIPQLGVVEYVINTPSNHRVHHSSNPLHYNKNLGGFTVLFDHLFGTFRSEDQGQVVSYGIPSIMEKKSILHEILTQWRILIYKVRKTPGVLKKIKLLFSSPNDLEGA